MVAQQDTQLYNTYRYQHTVLHLKLLILHITSPYNASGWLNVYKIIGVASLQKFKSIGEEQKGYKIN